MKASQLIRQLAARIGEVGDLEVVGVIDNALDEPIIEHQPIAVYKNNSHYMGPQRIELFLEPASQS